MSATSQRADELAEILERGLSAEEVDRELRELVSAAHAVGRHSVVPRPDPAFRSRLRAELVEAAERDRVGLLDRIRDGLRERTTRWRYNLRVGTATGLASLLIGGAGIGVAAQQAAPGDALYGVKRWTESARMTLASGTQETGALSLRFAGERLAEVASTHGTVDPDVTIGALQAMDRATRTGARDLIATYRETGDGAVLDALERFVAEQRRGLTAVFDALPAEARPFAEESLELLVSLQRQIDLLRGEPCETCGEMAAARGDTTLLSPDPAPGCEDCRPAGGSADRPDDPTSTGDPGAGDTPAPGTGGGGGDVPVSDPGGSDTGGVVDDTTDAVDDTLDDTTDAVDDVVDDTTDTVDDVASELPGDGQLGDTVDDTTDAVDDAVDDTTDAVDEVTGGLTDTLDGLLSPSAAPQESGTPQGASESPSPSEDDGGLLD